MIRGLTSVGAAFVILLVGWCAAEQPAARTNMKKVAKDSNAFAFDLYGRLRHQKGNLFFSPNSIDLALAMTYEGARGDTSGQMAKVLHYTLDRSELNEGFGALLREFNGAGKKRPYELRVANALWGQTGYAFLPDYLTTTRQYYGAGLRLVDFKDDTEGARATINRWVEDQTKNKIRDLIARGVLDSTTRLVLTNAIYFKGTWQHQFDKNTTRDAPFHTSRDKDVNKVQMMHQTGHFRYLRNGDLQILEQPYKGGDLSMFVLLPRALDGLAQLEEKLNAGALDSWLGKMRPTEVRVSLPRFRMTRELSLKDMLSNMGMPLPFSGAADFSGMDGTRNLQIAAVIHKAFVDVNEEGTEAAAATGVIMTLSAVLNEEQFQADHPFVFLIRDNRSGSILFLGRVENPVE